ncbi:MAG: TraX family protein [Alphaproteobacteria bacterium]
MRFFSGLYDKAQKQGKAYTALDAVKLLAIICMTIDHIGAYMLPENQWLRAIGRVAPVVFLFLVGYSRSTEISRQLWIYTAITIAIQPFMAYPLFPMNIMVSIIIARLALRYCIRRNWLPEKAHEIVIFCAVFSICTMPFFEYGSISILCAVFGRMVREGHTRHRSLVMISCVGLFVFWQYIADLYSSVQMLYIIASVGWITLWLNTCSNKVIWQAWDNSAWKTGITLLSRNTLTYYFYHRMIFQLIGALILGKTLGFTWIWMELD